MAKARKIFKLSELTCTVPESGQYPESETGTDGTKYVGLPPYEYEGLKSSLEDKGYVPDEYDFIAADVDGNVLYGGRRVWLMQTDMALSGDSPIEVEVMTKQEFFDELADRILDRDAMPTVEDDGSITPPKQILVSSISARGNWDANVWIEEHKKNPDIPDYPYDYVCEDGTVIDAGKS
jgi:hypothetical protein|tara:strand:- start:56 stop:592 length:537 start_codon:yes stop_codon:yes gene_type:complete